LLLALVNLALKLLLLQLLPKSAPEQLHTVEVLLLADEQLVVEDMKWQWQYCRPLRRTEAAEGILDIAAQEREDIDSEIVVE